MQKLADGTIISQTTSNGFGETVVQALPNTQGGFICTRSEYNAGGQLVKQYRDTGVGTDAMAATLYEYDAMGHLTRETLALAEDTTVENSPVTEWVYGAESTEEGVFSLTTTTRYNAAGQPLSSTQKQLISQLSSTLENKVISVSERGLTSTQWSVYNEATKRTQYSTVPTSSITAEAVTVDGFALSQKDTAGITTTASRQYTASGIIHTQTDGRGNATTTVTDIAGRTTSVTDAAGNTTTTAYDAHHDAPATITDALGNTTCYRYDERGREVAEWGTAVQPACFAYDEADHLVSLTTFRHPQAVISTDPADTAGDVTSWTYDPATGLELSKTYADNSSVVKTYDAFNRLATETDARSLVKTHSYEPARDLLLGTTYSDTTTPRSYAYNHLGQLTQVTDAAGVRSIGYNAFGEQEADSLLAGGKTHLITETRDTMGRSTGYVYSKDGSSQQTVTTGYGTDGRIATAGFLHGGVERQFSYAYLPGTNLLTSMLYKRGSTAVAQRSYTYDALGRPLTRAAHPVLWYITWDPTQPVATRPLAIQKDGTWYTYGWDLTKNICEVYAPAGYIRSAYTYAPYGEVTSEGDVTQPIQWSSEHNDTELGLVYYNYRHYNTLEGRWMERDSLHESTDKLLYGYAKGNPLAYIDSIGASVFDSIVLLIPAAAYFGLYAKQAYDYAGANDKKMHCYMACMLSQDLGKEMAYLISVLKEVTDLIRDKIKETMGHISEKQFEKLVMDSMHDYYSDMKCIHVQSKYNCKCCCNNV